MAAHPRFVPETARRLADPVFTGGLEISRYRLNDFVENQRQLLREVITGLDEHSTAALALIYMRNDSLESPVVLQESEREAVERLGSSLGPCVSALKAMNGSLAQYVQTEATSFWRFKHPTIGDAYASILLDNPEMLGIYVQGSRVDKLVDQITCGDVGLENSVALPALLFPQVLKRLNDFLSTEFKASHLSSWRAGAKVDRFFASRCSKRFLSLYIEEHPEVLDRVSRPGLYLSAVSEVDLAVRLHEFDLLPEDCRARFVAALIAYAVEGEDLYALESSRVQRLFTETELRSLRTLIRTPLLPKLSEVRGARLTDSPHGSPEERMQPFLDSLDVLKREFADDQRILSMLNRETERAVQWISEHEDDSGEEDARPRSFGEVDSKGQMPVNIRDIFEDVDE